MTIEHKKRPYQSPEIVELGAMEELTRGSGFGLRDFWVFGVDDVIGNCRHDSCAGS
jgi:hypothetical protein